LKSLRLNSLVSSVAALSFFNYVNSVEALLVQLDRSPFSSINISLKKNKEKVKGALERREALNHQSWLMLDTRDRILMLYCIA
jgi:hypothetical protein